MKKRGFTLPEIGFLAATRGALGIGIGLLIADKFTAEDRRRAGWTLFSFGALSTIPLIFDILGKQELS